MLIEGSEFRVQEQSNIGGPNNYQHYLGRFLTSIMGFKTLFYY